MLLVAFYVDIHCTQSWLDLNNNGIDVDVLGMLLIVFYVYIHFTHCWLWRFIHYASDKKVVNDFIRWQSRYIINNHIQCILSLKRRKKIWTLYSKQPHIEAMMLQLFAPQELPFQKLKSTWRLFYSRSHIGKAGKFV